jgi:hypothetical protein
VSNGTRASGHQKIRKGTDSSPPRA